MSERIRLLIRAAREVRSAELRDELLRAAEEESKAPPSQRLPRLEDTTGISFPLSIFLNAPDQGDVEAQLHEDATVVFDGAVYQNPSSTDLMKLLGFKAGNAWPRWKFRAPNGKVLPIQALRDCYPPLVQPLRKRRKRQKTTPSV